MKHKYLESINESYTRPYNKFLHPRRAIKDYRVYRKTGVYPYECYDLNDTMFKWLYEHVCQYYEDADRVVDLDYMDFLHLDKRYTMREMLLLLKEDLEYVITHSYPLTVDEHKAMKLRRDDAFDILKEIADALWW